MRRALVGALIVLVLLVVGIVLGREPSPTPAATTASTTAPPHTPAPYAVNDSAALTVPEETRFAPGTFWATAGVDYLVTMDLESMKPEGSGGRSMYLGVTLSCSPRAGGPGISVGGTQNMLTGESTTYRNQGLISVPVDGAIDCSIKASAPYDDVASNGTTFTIDATWRAVPVDASALAAEEGGLPRTIADGADEAVMTVDLPLDQLPGSSRGDEMRALTTLHLTTCTIVNGSREDGRAWCSAGTLDEKGSTVSAEARAVLVGDDGTVCADLGDVAAAAEHIDLYRHHHLISLELVHELPEDPCGDTVRVAVSVHNTGPAPVVVHRSNSSLVVVSH